MPLLFIAGHLLSKWYQEAKLIAEDIVAADETGLQVETKGMLEHEWLAYLDSERRRVGGKCVEHPRLQPLVLHSTLGYIGGLEELIVWATQNNEAYKDPRDMPEYAEVEDELQTLADREFAAYIAANPSKQFVYLDFSSLALEASASAGMDAGASRPGTSVSRPGTQGTARRRSVSSAGVGAIGEFGPHRVIIELFTDKCPQTCENFMRLCTGSAGEAVDPASNVRFPLHYTGSMVHRVVRDGWLQGGDIVSGRGCDGHSALGSQTFPDENLSIPLSSSGLVVMANRGPHTNHSQFLITLRPLPAFNGRYVVFGRVIYGQATLEMINTLPCKFNQRPIDPLRIVASDVFTPAMLDENAQKWTRTRFNKSRKKKSRPVAPVKDEGETSSPRIPPKNATLLVVGFENSGKSTLVNNLLGRPFEATNPTVGFERNTVTVPPSDMFGAAFNVQLYGLGGAPNIRGYWSNYADAAHGIMFVVDASVTDEGVWKELAQSFKDLLNHPLLSGKPVVVFCNKQDRPGALSMTEVSMRLHADSIMPNIHFVKCTARMDQIDATAASHAAQSPISPISAALASPTPSQSQAPSVGSSTDVDPNIVRGLHWMIGRIAEQYQQLSDRVARDIAEVKKAAKAKMEETREKIRKEREEREAKEQQQQ